MNYIHLNETIFQKSNFVFEIFFKHCPFLDGLTIAIKGIAISLQALINISLGFISCSFQVDNVILSADLAVIFFSIRLVFLHQQIVQRAFDIAFVPAMDIPFCRLDIVMSHKLFHYLDVGSRSSR